MFAINRLGLAAFALSLSHVALSARAGASTGIVPTVLACMMAQAGDAGDPGWPRTFSKGGTSIMLYQPQVDSWTNHETIEFRCAVEVVLEGQKQPSYGVIDVTANTSVDSGNTTVYMTGMQVKSMNFPGTDPTTAAALQAVVTEMLPNKPMIEIALPRVLAYMHDQPKPAGVDINLNPPPIYYSDSPAILLGFIGQPQFKPIANTKLMFAVNTNWILLMDIGSATYYLLNQQSWLKTQDPMKGPWTAANSLPAEFSKLPSGAEWDEVRANMPGKPATVVPNVIATAEPSELIVTNGPAEYSPIFGTSLMYVSNPTQPVFSDLMNSTYYYLVAGRWFSAPSLNGPWAAASANLPVEFAKIPADSPVGYVLPSVPGTEQATDAVMISQIPHKSTVTINGDVTVKVAYDGDPKFVAIQGTPMKYATNTAYQVIWADNQYYCCYNGVWFIGGAPLGPWAVCTTVPAVIYTIPPSCPVYNCTYVKVYSSTPTTVVVGYTAGYSGSYVAATGALMFGAGVAVGAILANNDCWHGCYPCCYSYGCGAYCHYGYGGCGWYGGGGSCYGPYGSASHCAGYNPYTGTYARSGEVNTPYGSAHGTQAYNPYTNTYGAHAGGSNGYSSWGASTVSHGDQWASATHTTNDATGVTHGYAENSSGQSMNYAHKGDSSIGEGSNGDMYASHDGNVYKKGPNGNWNTYQNGSWQQTAKQPDDVNRDSYSRDYSNSHSSWGGGDSWGDRSGGGGGRWGGGGGGGGFRGRR